MDVIRKVRIQDAPRLKSVLGCETIVAAEDKIRGKTIYTDNSYSCLSFCTFTSSHAVIIRFKGDKAGYQFTDDLLRFFFFEKKIYKVSVIIPVDDKYTEDILIRNGFLQEAVLHEELYVEDSFKDAGLFYITMPMYKNYNVGFVPFQRGVIAVSGGIDYVDSISFLRFDETPSNEYLKLCADYCGLTKDGKMRPRGDIYYKAYEAEDLPAEVMRAVKEIREYLFKERTSFDINISLPETSDFRLSVWECLKKIPYGFTKSYEDIALELTGGNIKEARKLTRAVGHACSENPVPIIIPCHRVIGKDGKLVGFTGGVEFKDFLLTHELFAALPLV